MATLDSGLRSDLDATIGKARAAAEKAASTALTTLAVNQDDAFARLSPEDRQLRNQLRAKGRQLGDRERMDLRQPLGRDWALVRDCAYEQWHRMLFARFLAENGLLIHPEAQVPLSLEDCAQLAAEEGITDPWLLVADYAARMLPGIFRADDPLLHISLAAEGRQDLERLLESIPRAVFTSEDGLGWVYQFWQSQRKAEVNASGVKIGGVAIAPVTQLFTEPYMVQFLLHNTLGAWWTARHPEDPLVAELTYLRRLDDGTPAAGTFADWPQRAAEVTVMDPCCGSGHFLVAAFDLLRRMRETEEGLTPAEACAAVLRDNIHGLEIDARCTQIAAFALALASWKAAGFQELPVPNIACSGIPVGGRLYEWTSLAKGDTILAENLRQLYELFLEAPELGSLIDPAREVSTGLFASDPLRVLELLDRVSRRERQQDDPAAAAFGEAVRGTLRAVELLSKQYKLIATNVPYLARGKQSKVLQDYCGRRYPNSKSDLATAFLERCCSFCAPNGSFCLVSPQNWLFLGSYKILRERLLRNQQWNVVIKIGENGFRSSQAAGAFTALTIMTKALPGPSAQLAGLDVAAPRNSEEKDLLLRSLNLIRIRQASQLLNPDSRVAFDEVTAHSLLENYAGSYQGVKTGDDERFRRCFWELPYLDKKWRLYQSTVEDTTPFGGLEHIINWSEDGTNLARLQGISAWGKIGVAVSQMRHLPCALYYGAVFDSNMSAVVAKNPEHRAALWAFCQSSEFNHAVRRIDQSLKPTNSALVKVPFDLARWQAVADAAGPLPKPHSDDPTQWLFHGHPVRSTEPLQVAVARLLGYRWPQNEEDGLRRFADEDGIICLPPVAGEPPAADRLRAILAAAYGEAWSPATLERLLAGVGFGGKGLDAWLRDGAGFFKQHCALFHNRPFLWQIWDGRRDGFSAIVNYHGLDGRKLDRLIYTYLGAWIAQQSEDARAGITGADLRLGAAQALQRKLVAIREGEASQDGKTGYDIYVRWKPLAKQPIGWEPDLNDGVRLNIRPFVTAGVLRAKFTIHWNKDRGNNPDGSERLNDLHFTRAQKEAARRQGARG